jgi:hypothetical protein
MFPSNQWTDNTHFLKALLVPGFALPNLEDVGTFVANDDAFCRQVCTFLPKLCNLDIAMDEKIIGEVEINSCFGTLEHIRRVAIRPSDASYDARFRSFSRRSVKWIQTHRVVDFALFQADGVAKSLFDWLSEVHCLSRIKFSVCELVYCTDFSHPTLLEWEVYRCFITVPGPYRSSFYLDTHGPPRSNCPRATYLDRQRESEAFWSRVRDMMFMDFDRSTDKGHPRKNQ